MIELHGREKVIFDNVVRLLNGFSVSLTKNDFNKCGRYALMVTHEDSACQFGWNYTPDVHEGRFVSNMVWRIRQAFFPDSRIRPGCAIIRE